MTSIVLVDWLGRGGIAQTSQEWQVAARGAGHDVTVVTRAGRDLAGEAPAERGGRLRAHRDVALHAANVISDARPDVVVVQNYVLPALEAPVYAAVRRVGARLVVVVHDHKLHSLAGGNRIGLRRTLRRADAVVAHTRFVGDAVAQWSGRAVETIPHPIAHALVDAPTPAAPPFVPDDRLLALHFGVLKRGYKGTETVVRVAASAPAGWRFGLMGAGSPGAAPNVEVVSGYVSNGELAAAIRASSATLLPYKIATQSGAVVAAQALGSVPVASAVGGIPEQIFDGVTGILLPRDAPVDAWRATLERLGDDSARRVLVENAVAHARAQHERFVDDVDRLVTGRG